LLDTFGCPDDSEFAEFEQALASLDVENPEISATLITLKERFNLAWARRFTDQCTDFALLGQLQCDFADSSIDLALRAACAQTLTKQKIRFDPVFLKSGFPGLFIFGLGKLGGMDLNFSSDVDLVAFYDPESFPVPQHMGQGYIADKILKRMSQILKPRHSAGFVWRVDWRLRPDSSASHLAMPIDIAQEYYFFRAMPWHRLALMKARVIAGDQRLGRDFQDAIAPFIWRQNLDYRALDELAHLKSRINQEHPGLRHERKAHARITEDAAGFNVKLGHGGIREIEFFTNAQQLIWGGKQYGLRTTNTLEALSTLNELGHISPDNQIWLEQSYKTLREIENALQMIDNNQTHILPVEPEKQRRLVKLLDIDNWDQLNRDIHAIRPRVFSMFSDLFGTGDTVTDEREAGQDRDMLDSWIDSLDLNFVTIAKSWIGGFRDYGVAADKAQRFESLGYRVLANIRDAGIDPKIAISNVDEFFRALSKSEQYFRLLDKERGLLDILIPPLIYSPHMALLLRQSPHIIDVFLSPDDTTDSSFVFQSADYETRLERLRRYVNENLFRYYHHHLSGRDTAKTLQQNLTRLATDTVRAALRIANADLGITADQAPISIVGLGKMGTKRMAPLSDLDLVFIFDGDGDTDLPARFVRRMRTILTARLSEGVAYELDMRLRPSGRSGPPAVMLESFVDHHESRAWNWEHIALAHGRVIAGNPALSAKVEAARLEIMDRQRDQDQFKKDAKAMWHRIVSQRGTRDSAYEINAKLCAGGLMEAEFLDACFNLLKLDQSALAEPIAFWSKLQTWERLLNLTGMTVDAVPPFYHGAMCRQFMIEDIRELEDQMNANREVVTSISEHFYGSIDLPEDHEEGRINWING